MRTLVGGALVGLVVATSACGGRVGTAAPPADGLRVVATTPVLGQLTTAIVGDAGTVGTLMPRGQDPHGYAPSARQVEELRAADLVVANGLGLEGTLADTLEAAEADGVRTVHVGELVDPLPAEQGGGEHHDDHGPEGHGSEPLDPHIWLDPVRMADAATVIATALDQFETAPEVDWAQRGSALAEELLAVHDEVESILAEVPDACRVLVTAHDSLGYFAARYGFEVIGSVIPGTSTQAGASAGHVAELARVLEQRGVPAVFAETSESSRLADTLAAEVGREVAVVELPAGTLGEPGSPTATYRGMLATTAELVADALDDC